MSAVKYHTDFPPKKLQWDSIIPLLGEAHACIARFDGMLDIIHNKEILLAPLLTKEAEASSRIEGTQATMREVLEFEANGDDKQLSERKKNDIAEIINYRNAMTDAVKDLKTLPICNRIILKAHKKLMTGVRGRDKAPGAYRNIANWIGSPGCAMEQAYYIPPAANEVPGLMSRWEKYINKETTDKLIQLAVMHAEFEAIHPFLDGNGRPGRMLIPLYMFQRKLIHTPAFYISSYLEANREEYYERLREVSHNHDWTGWCVFFLEALYAQAQSNLHKVTKIWKLYNSLKENIPRLIRSQFTITVLDEIFKSPIFLLSKFVEMINVPESSARRVIKIMENNDILETVMKPGGRRSGLMVFTELFTIAGSEDIF